MNKKVTGTYKQIENGFKEKFLEEDEKNPSGYTLRTGKTAETVTKAYKKIEDTVVGGYKKIEKGFVDTFLERVEPDEEHETK